MSPRVAGPRAQRVGGRGAPDGYVHRQLGGESLGLDIAGDHLAGLGDDRRGTAQPKLLSDAHMLVHRVVAGLLSIGFPALAVVMASRRAAASPAHHTEIASV